MLKRNAFNQHLKKATKETGFVVDSKHKKDLYVIVHGQAMRCDLDMLYSAYKNAPDRLDDIVQTHLKVLKQIPPPPPAPTQKETAESLLPMLQQEDWLKQANQSGAIPLHSRPFKAGLGVAYVFDNPQYRAYINGSMMADLMSKSTTMFQDIHEYALNNLRLRTSSKLVQTQGIGDNTLIVCETNDGFAATRILLPDLIKTWQSRIPGKMLLAIPNRGFLIAFSDRHPEKTAVVHQIREDFKSKEFPLTPDLFVWQLGQIREYAPKQ